ncbi:MAG: molybdopterin molybdotransferase MoeA [Gemmatimonadota bacterium]|nr:molybdopterin molybdotransferase MoeA [Gemmatimonadota bacterium]
MAGFERLQADWLSYGDALARVLADARPTPATPLAPARALGRSLAAPVVARATLPSWPNSAMDGFAVRSADLREPSSRSIRLPVAGHSYPGSVPLEDVPPGAAIRIMTGGPLPVGFDSVIRVEHTDGEASAGFVEIHRTEDVGRHIRSPGKDMRRGDETVPAGAVVHSGTLPVIMASGAESLAVFRRPRVGVLSSGDELVGQDRFDLVVEGRGIPDTNRDMIAAAVAEAGGVPVDLGVAPDDPDALKAALESVEGVDVLVSTGGASMGEKDLLKRILLGLAFRLDFWRARVRPGSPLSFGHLRRGAGDLPVFGLPGNPAPAFVTFHVFVVPYLRAMLGSRRPAGTTVTAVTETTLGSPPRLTQFYRVRFLPPRAPGEAEGCTLTGPQGSGLVRSLRDAEGLAVVPEGTSRIEAGDPVSVLLLPGRQ